MGHNYATIHLFINFFHTFIGTISKKHFLLCAKRKTSEREQASESDLS